MSRLICFTKNHSLAVFLMLVIAAILAVTGLTNAQTLPNYTGYAPAYVPPRSPVTFTVSVAPVFSRTSINFHNDQWSTVAQKTQIQGDVALTVPAIMRATYSMTTGITTNDAFTPINSLKIGETDFKKTDTGTGTTQQTKTVAIEYRESLFQRLSFAAQVNYPIKPLVVLEWPIFTITGNGGEQGGKIVTDTETFRRTFYGIGATLELITQNAMSVECAVAASNNYTFVQGIAKYRLRQNSNSVNRVSNNINVELLFGGIHREFKTDGLRVRTTAPFVGLAANF